MAVERLAAKEAVRLLRRSPVKYARGVSGMYLLSIKGLELGRAARATFFFFRHIDDLLDGDRPGIQNPLSYVGELRSQIASGNGARRPEMAQLAHYSLEVLERKARPGDNPRRDFLEAIDAITFDFERAKTRRALSVEELNDYYRRLFFPLVNIMLIGINSSLRAQDIPAFSYSQGRVYSVRDMEGDWRQGIINIPREVLQPACLSPNSPFVEVKGNQVVRNWYQNELSQTRAELLALQADLASSPERLTFMMCNGLIQPMLKLINRYTTKAT